MLKEHIGHEKHLSIKNKVKEIENEIAINEAKENRELIMKRF